MSAVRGSGPINVRASRLPQVVVAWLRSGEDRGFDRSRQSHQPQGVTMRRMLAVLLYVSLAAPAVRGADIASSARVTRPLHTFSIVARDSVTGEIGVAVQSHWFSVGTVVSWAEAGVRAVATQPLAEVTYGPLGLELMRAGKTAPQALESLLAG